MAIVDKPQDTQVVKFQKYHDVVATVFAVKHAIPFLFAAFTFTWVGVIAFALLYFATGCLGICVGYHRLLTHGGFKTFKFIRVFLEICGICAGEGPPRYWLGRHREHHEHSDTAKDPHSPHFGGFWFSHMLWMLKVCGSAEEKEIHKRYTKKLYESYPELKFFSRIDVYITIHLILIVLLFLTGFLIWDLYTGISLVVWGYFVRIIWVMHITWCVNSATHLWGYRNYDTKDQSRNSWWVGLLAFGEGWHNNHHAQPTSAQHGHRWWELDPAWWCIRIMEAFGLAWDVKRPNLNKLGNTDHSL